MNLLTRIAAWWRRDRVQCVVCQVDIPQDAGYCSDECWESTHL